MIAKIQVWGRHGENVAGGPYEGIRITTEDRMLTEDAKKAIISAINGIEARDGIAMNVSVRVVVGGRKYEFRYTSEGLARL